MLNREQKLEAIKQISKCCFYCSKPIRWYHLTIGCCGAFDYVRTHRKCAGKERILE